MSPLFAEMRLFLRSGWNSFAVLLLLVLSLAAVLSGIAHFRAQERTIARVEAEQVRDLSTVEAAQAGPDGDPGYNAYYAFMLTQDPPPPLAFAAIGQRDLQPFVLRVRALGLEQQRYDSETYNAELALPGAFDWAFVLIYLAPLIIIALAHDLVTGEREAGRLRLLLSLPGSGLWRRRAGLRYAFVLAALGLPLCVGAAFMAAPLAGTAALIVTAAIYTAFWFGLVLLVGSAVRSSTVSAAAQIGAWIVLTLVLPTLANAAIQRTIPAAKGVDLTLAQREIIHRGWDIPKEQTFARFFDSYPEWRGKEAFEGRFHWKWYYAMHQVGDEAVADDVAAYRGALAARQAWTERLGYVLPGVAAMTIIHRVADTDTKAQFAYQDSIAAYHEQLRRFYYPYLFNDQPFTRADFAAIPLYAPRVGTGSFPLGPFLAVCVLGGVMLLLGARRISKIGAPKSSEPKATF